MFKLSMFLYIIHTNSESPKLNCFYFIYLNLREELFNIFGHEKRELDVSSPEEHGVLDFSF